MNQPIKIIHKYKNNNRKIQYNVLIFVGNLISESLNKILIKIRDKNLYDTLIDINSRDIELLLSEYGEKWYKNFFIDKHIKYTFDIIIKNNEAKKKNIIDKYGIEWFNNHIDNYIDISQTIYSYQSIFKNNKELKIKNIKNNLKNKDITIVSNDNNIVGGGDEISNIYGGNIDISNNSLEGVAENYEHSDSSEYISDKEFVNKIKNRIELENSVINIINKGSQNDSIITEQEKSNLFGGSKDEDDDEIESDNDIESDADIDILSDDITDQNNLYDTDQIDEINIEDLERNEEDVEYDKNVEQINETLQKLINKTELEDKSDIYSKMSEWDKSKENLMYDEEMINVYSKIYIYNQYICSDDTIKILKNKLCCGYKKSSTINKLSPYFIPSRLYLWSEYSYYDFNNVLHNEKLMLGQKWIKQNEILDIDIEPNDNLRNYEILKGNLKNLQENIKKYSSRINYENDEQIIINDYSDFITNNEIYMIDIYNELGINYNASDDVLKNLYDVYVKIYFSYISQEELKNIIIYLQKSENSKVSKNSDDIDSDNKINIEDNKIILTYNNIRNDLLMDNEILKTVEELKKTPYLYNNIFKENYITQSVIHINIKHKNFKNSQKIELYRIFDNFIVNEKYPFIQFQTAEGKYIFKYYSLNNEYDKDAILAKWFENSPYGISFKINMEQKGKDNRYIAISLNENGRIDYKTQWKEEDQASLEDIKKSYNEVRDLLRKVNIENNKLKVEIPINEKFKFAFINTIQQFELPENFLISHNDLSDFCRYFYPYIAVVIEPRKRKSKVLKKNEKSKYGTYLRFKRISKYENEASIAKRIVYFLKNYEFNEKLLILEISKQFNITEKDASEKITNVIDKYPRLKKSRNVLKKFENIPKYKPPGIGIDIQGKQRNKYKMRISGARSKNQLSDIILFMNILIYLYIETYLYKKPNRQQLKEKLKNITNIAKRRNKVDDIINTSTEVKNIKQITKLDKERLGYKPEKGQNQWTRNCQNSGTKKRRPIPYTDKNIEDMITSGYVYNTKTGDYEKTISVKNGKKKENVVLSAAKINNYDGEGNSMYYTCDPAENGEYMYVGFLSRSANPHGLCMPCCFKKNPAISNNKIKKDYHLRCLGKLSNETKTKKISGDKLYILQDTNKIQDDRFGYLPEYLDMYINNMLNKDKIIKNNYLTSSKNGWFFKYGSKQDDDIFLTTIAISLDITIQHIKDRITEVLLKEDNSESIFVSLNNGDIKSQFGTIESYIRFLHTNFEIEYTLVADILAIPGVIHDNGINIIIIEKNKQIIYDEFEKDNFKDDFNIKCNNTENLYMFQDPNRINIILLKDEFNYYPIYEIKKKEDSKNIDIYKFFKYEPNSNNIIYHLYQYIKINFSKIVLDNSYIENAKNIFTLMEHNNMSKYCPTKQVIDKRNKCKYFICQDKFILPVKPSGALFWIPCITEYDKYINPLDSTSEFIYNVYLNSNKQIIIKPNGFYYSEKNDDNYTINELIIDQNIYIPIKQSVISDSDIISFAKKYKIREFLLESKSIYDFIDKQLKNNNFQIDDRINNVNRDKYIQEGYNIFRLELAYYLKDQDKLREKIIKLINKNNIDNITKKTFIKRILYKIINKQLYDLYINNESYLSDSNQSDSDQSESNNSSSSSSADKSNTEDSDANETDYLDDIDLNPINISESIDIDDKQKGGNNDSDNFDSDNLNMFVNLNKRLVVINDVEPNLSKYNIKNNREICPTNNDKNACNINVHCQWKNNSCLFKSTSKQIIQYINRISDELVNYELKSNELLSKDNYFVSDTVNRDNYINRNNQKIIKSNNSNIKKILSELFGKNNIPIIGKRRINKTSTVNNIDYPLEIIGNRMYQIVHYSNSIYRAFVNSYYWIKNNLMDTVHRNLGYYSVIQTELTNYFKSQVIEWITNKNNQNILLSELGDIFKLNKHFINELKHYLATSSIPLKAFIIDVYILSKIHKHKIILYDNYDNVIGIFNNGLIYLANYYGTDNSEKNQENLNKNNINIKYNINNFSFSSPTVISSIYIN